MSIDYKAIKKGQPGIVGGGQQKYYASIVRGKKVDLRTFVEEIAEMNTLNTADVFAVLETFLQIGVRHLSDGRSINMGQLGNFSPSLQSYPEESAREVDRSSIKSFKVNFRPSTILRDRLSTVKFEKVGGEEEVVEEE